MGPRPHTPTSHGTHRPNPEHRDKRVPGDTIHLHRSLNPFWGPGREAALQPHPSHATPHQWAPQRTTYVEEATSHMRISEPRPMVGGRAEGTPTQQGPLQRTQCGNSFCTRTRPPATPVGLRTGGAPVG